MAEQSSDTRARLPWLPPLLATVVTAPGGGLLVTYAGVSRGLFVLCRKGELAPFEASFERASHALEAGLVAAAVLTLASWVLPWRRRYTVARVLCASLASLTVLALFPLFHHTVEWC